jgi:TatD DNase family protein
MTDPTPPGRTSARSEPRATNLASEARSEPQASEVTRPARSEPRASNPASEARSEPQASEVTRPARSEPRASNPASEARSAPRTSNPASEARSAPRASNPASEARSEPQASEVTWFDSHCHITAAEFDADRDEVLARASQAGVATLLAVGAGYGVEHNERALALAAKDPRVVAAVGIHPHDAAHWSPGVRDRLRGWLAAPRVVALGECGLDYHYDHSPRETQRAAFAEQVALAREARLPVSIHVRGDDDSAYDDLLAIWRAERGREVGGVLHCYTGSLAFARRALDESLFVSFSGILTFKRDRGLREVARALPLDRLLVETDAPLLAPEGFRGRRNEPARVANVGATLAELHGVTPHEVARATDANARRLFRLREGAA